MELNPTIIPWPVGLAALVVMMITAGVLILTAGREFDGSVKTARSISNTLFIVSCLAVLMFILQYFFPPDTTGAQEVDPSVVGVIQIRPQIGGDVVVSWSIQDLNTDSDPICLHIRDPYIVNGIVDKTRGHDTWMQTCALVGQLYLSRNSGGDAAYAPLPNRLFVLKNSLGDVVYSDVIPRLITLPLVVAP